MVSSPEQSTDTRVEGQLRRLAGLAAMVGGLIAVVALVGWAAGIGWLTNFGAVISTMKANTAISLAAAALALLALRRESRPPWMTAVGFALAAIPTLVGALTLSEMMSGRDLGIDQLLVRDLHPSFSTVHPGRMGINTAFAVLMLGCAVLMLDPQRVNRSRVLQLPALVVGIVAFGAIIGYIDDIASLYAVPAYTGMSLPTGIGLFALAVACFLARPQSGFTAFISRADSGARLTRRLLPLAICVPVLLDWLRLRGEYAGWYDVEAGVVMFLVANMICLLTFIMLAVSPLNAMLRELRRSRSDVLTERATLAAILASADHCVISVDVDGVITTFNRAAERWLGYEASELIGQQTPVIFHDPREVAALARQLSTEMRRPVDPGFEVLVALAKLGLTDEREWTYVRKDGSRFPVSLTVTALRDYNGGIVGFVGIASDITERREMERLKNEFISTVSHELRTPLTSIRGSLALLEGGMVEGVGEQARSLVHIAYNNCERLIRLINDILDVEKIAAGKMAFAFREVALQPLVQECLTANQSYAAQRGVKLRLTDYLSGVRVNVDPDRFSQVMSNLLSNAAKFSPDGTEVDVTIGPGPRGARVSVADRGAGVPEDFRSRIFSRFAQADASDRRRTGGTGLGLSIGKAIVERMDGNIGYEPRPGGGGSIFYFDLPLVDPTTATSSARHTVSDGPRILVCEDDADLATQLVETLVEGGFQADIAPDAASARRWLKDRSYDAMTLDIVLPGEDGLSLLRSLRAEPATAHLPVVVVSMSSEQEAGAGIQGGALTTLGWLGKPLDPARLLEVLREALPGEPQRRLSILHVEDDADLRAVVENTLKPEADVTAAADLAQARAVLDSTPFDLVIVDLMLPDGTGDRLVEELSRRYPALPVLIFSAYDPSPALAERVAGVLAKSRTSNNDLLQTIRKAVGRRQKAEDAA